MAERDPIIWDDNPEWTDGDRARARPASDVHGAKIAAAMVRRRGRPAGSNKERVTMRLDKDVLEKFKATGPGWQSRINEALKKVKVAGKRT